MKLTDFLLLLAILLTFTNLILLRYNINNRLAKLDWQDSATQSIEQLLSPQKPNKHNKKNL